MFSIEEQTLLSGFYSAFRSTAGSAVLSKGPIPNGTIGDVAMKTVFGKVTAPFEFLQTGTDGVPLAQASASSKWTNPAPSVRRRRKTDGKEGYSDTPLIKPSPLSAPGL